MKSIMKNNKIIILHNRSVDKIKKKFTRIHPISANRTKRIAIYPQILSDTHPTETHSVLIAWDPNTVTMYTLSRVTAITQRRYNKLEMGSPILLAIRNKRKNRKCNISKR